MSATGILVYASMVSALVLAAGLGAVMMPLFRGWYAKDINEQMLLLRQAADYEVGLLLPGMAASGVSNIMWAAESDHNLFTEGWLVTLLILWILSAFILLPLMGLGLRRARLLSLQAAKTGKVTPELERALADKVPLVFGCLITVIVLFMAWLRLFAPF